MGDKYRTVQNLEIIKKDLENQLLFVKGSIPGSKNSEVTVTKSIKNISKSTIVEKLKLQKKQKILQIKKEIIMKIDKISIDGKKNTLEVTDKIFTNKINKKLISEILYKNITISKEEKLRQTKKWNFRLYFKNICTKRYRKC